ncbi:MAG: hypothetical protein ACREAB_17660 [Blastocatellia bacterium]
MLKRFCLTFCLLALVGPACLAQAQSAENIIPVGTEIQLTLRDPVSSKLSEPGDEVIAVVRRDVVVDGRRVLREGTEVVGQVTLAQAAKRPLKGGRLHIRFDRIRLEGEEQKISAVMKSASDFTRDEKAKSDGEGTLHGGVDGGKVIDNVLTAASLGSIGVTIAILAGQAASDNQFGGFIGGISQGGAIAGASVLGGSAITGVFMTKGKEVRLDEHAVVRLKLVRPVSLE